VPTLFLGLRDPKKVFFYSQPFHWLGSNFWVAQKVNEDDRFQEKQHNNSIKDNDITSVQQVMSWNFVLVILAVIIQALFWFNCLES
jgi:hypothetical protein